MGPRARAPRDATFWARVRRARARTQQKNVGAPSWKISYPCIFFTYAYTHCADQLTNIYSKYCAIDPYESFTILFCGAGSLGYAPWNRTSKENTQKNSIHIIHIKKRNENILYKQKQLAYIHRDNNKKRDNQLRKHRNIRQILKKPKPTSHRCLWRKNQKEKTYKFHEIAQGKTNRFFPACLVSQDLHLFMQFEHPKSPVGRRWAAAITKKGWVWWETVRRLLWAIGCFCMEKILSSTIPKGRVLSMSLDVLCLHMRWSCFCFECHFLMTCFWHSIFYMFFEIVLYSFFNQ